VLRQLLHQRVREFHVLCKSLSSDPLIAVMCARIVKIIEHGVDAIARQARPARVHSVGGARGRQARETGSRGAKHMQAAPATVN